MSDIKVLFNLPPAEAVDYLKKRDKLTTTFSWQDLMREEHLTQFTVSRLTRLDILQAMKDGISKSVDGELSRRDWTKNAKTLLQNAGLWGTTDVTTPTGDIVSTTFDNARLKLIFDTNTRMAYAAGQWERAWRNQKTHPYLRYVSLDDGKTRPQHRAWHNVVLPITHEFWKTHYPPNGWRCRCRVVSVSKSDYATGKSPTGEPYNTTAPKPETREWLNKTTGEVERIPVGIDPGFNYNPGIARLENMAKVARSKLEAASPELRHAALAPTVVKPVSPAFEQTVNQTLAQIPEAVRIEVMANGVEVKLTPTLTAAVPRLVDKTPRGYAPGQTWDHTDGVYLHGDRVLVIAETALDVDTGERLLFNAVRAAASTRHEMGHAWDAVRELSASAAFISAYQQDVDRLRPWLARHDMLTNEQFDDLSYLLQGGVAGAQEAFAEVFAALLGGSSIQSLNVLEAFPALSKVLKKLLDTMK